MGWLWSSKMLVKLWLSPFLELLLYSLHRAVIWDALLLSLSAEVVFQFLMCRGHLSLLGRVCIQVQVTRHFSGHLALGQSWWVLFKGVGRWWSPRRLCMEWVLSWGQWGSGCEETDDRFVTCGGHSQAPGGGASGLRACKWWASSGRARAEESFQALK